MNMKQLTDAEVIAGLNAGLSMSADGYRRAAPYYVEAVRRGLDFSDVQSPMLAFLPDVSNGRLCPEILVRFGANPPLVAAVAKLPTPVQAQLVRGNGKVEVAEPSGKVRHVRLVELSKPQVKRVVGESGFRSPDEQRPLVGRHSPGRYKAKPPVVSGFDIRGSATPRQLADLETAAARAGVAEAHLLVRWAVAANLLPGSPVVVTDDVRRALQDRLGGQRAA